METLPSEIITQILEYLPFDDRRELARVNKAFYHASSHPVFLRKELLNYKPCEINLNNFNDFKNMLWKSKRKLLCLKLVSTTFIDDLPIFTNLGNHIISLSIMNLDLLNDSFLDAIAQCCNLEKLELKSVSDLILTDNDRKPILKLCSISLNMIHMSDREFNVILKLAPNLKDLSILGCNLIGEYSVIKRFYPHNSDIDCSLTKYNSSNIFSEDNIVHHLNHFVRLNSLRLNNNSNIFYRIQPIQLEIKSLSFNLKDTIHNRSIDFEKLNLVLSQYVFLEQLEILFLPVEWLSIVSKLHNLRHLTLSYTDNDLIYSDVGPYIETFVKSLKNLKYIRTLSFNRDFNLIRHHFKCPIYPLLECTLKSLTSLNCSFDSYLEVLKYGQNLTNLRIKSGENLKVEDLQLLFRNLTNLKHLWIDHCLVLNDNIFFELPISNLKELITLKITPSNISHRCLRRITNPRLKVLTLTALSLEPCSTLVELNEFRDSLKMLSLAVPRLTQLIIPVHYQSLKTIDLLDNLTYFQTTFKALLTTYFKSLKIFILW